MEYRDFTDQEIKWIKSLERVMKKAPDTLFMFIGAGSMIIHPLKENGNRYITDTGAMDGNAPGEYIPTKMVMDGGDW